MGLIVGKVYFSITKTKYHINIVGKVYFSVIKTKCEAMTDQFIK